MHCIIGSKHVSQCAFSANATPLCSSTGSKLEEPSSRCCLGQATASSGSTHFSSRHPKNSGINTSDKCTKDQCTHTHTSLDKHAACNNQVSRPKPLLLAVPGVFNIFVATTFDDFQTECSAAMRYGNFGE